LHAWFCGCWLACLFAVFMLACVEGLSLCRV
jgi:hypothetical protein